MKLWIALILAAILVVWLYTKWVKSQAYRKIEREGAARAKEDVEAAIAIAEEVDEKSKDIAADELDAMRVSRRSRTSN